MLIDIGLIFIVATIPLIFAAVQPHIWSFYAGLVFVLFSLKIWKNGFALPPLQNKLFISLIFIFFTFTLFQVLPLPPAVMSLLSPAQYSVLKKTSGLLSIELPWHAISYVPRAAFAWWLYLLSLCLFFILLKNYLDSTQKIMRITGILAGVALLESLYGLIQALIPSLGVLWASHVTQYLGDARGTYINRNHLAGFIEMVWPIGLGMIFIMAAQWQRVSPLQSRAQNRFKNFLASENIGIQLLFFTGMLIILLALLFSRSRAGIGGALIGFLSFVSLIHFGHKRLSSISWGLFGLSACFLIFYGSLIGFEELMGRFLEMDENAGSRFNIWKDTIAIIKNHPLGIGLYNYQHVLPVYNESAPLGIKFTHAHNDYLQLLAEAGWPGFLTLVTAFYVFIGKSIWRIRKFGRGMDPTRFYIGIGALSGLISIAFHSFFDFNLQIPANCLYFVVLLALVEGCLKKSG